MGFFPSLSVPVSSSPSGSAGGGNIFQVGSLFGSSSNGATSYGGDGAAAGAGAGQSAPAAALLAAASGQAAGGTSTWLPYVLIGAVLVAAAWLLRK